MMLRITCLLALLAAAGSAAAQPPTVETIPIRDGLYLLQGRGGNVLASVGGDGVLLVDSDYENYQPAYLEAVEALGAEAVRFLINTHWHGDHTGGNKAWGGTGSVIMAHDNVRLRMSTRQDMKMFNRVVEPSPVAAWPLVTYENSLALHVNGQTVEVQHYPAGLQRIADIEGGAHRCPGRGDHLLAFLRHGQRVGPWGAREFRDHGARSPQGED